MDPKDRRPGKGRMRERGALTTVFGALRNAWEYQITVEQVDENRNYWEFSYYHSHSKPEAVGPCTSVGGWPFPTSKMIFEAMYDHPTQLRMKLVTSESVRNGVPDDKFMGEDAWRWRVDGGEDASHGDVTVGSISAELMYPMTRGLSKVGFRKTAGDGPTLFTVVVGPSKWCGSGGLVELWMKRKEWIWGVESQLCTEAWMC